MNHNAPMVRMQPNCDSKPNAFDNEIYGSIRRLRTLIVITRSRRLTVITRSRRLTHGQVELVRDFLEKLRTVQKIANGKVKSISDVSDRTRCPCCDGTGEIFRYS